MTTRYYEGQDNIFYNENSDQVYIKAKPGQTLNISGTAGASGSDTQVQFNDAGNFGADANFTFNKTTDTLSVTNTKTNSIESFSGGEISIGEIDSFVRVGEESDFVSCGYRALSDLRAVAFSSFIGTSPENNILNDVKYINGQFYIIASGNGSSLINRLYRTEDGITFEQYDVLPSLQNWTTLCHAQDIGVSICVSGQQAGVGSNAAGYSAANNPLSWTSSTLPASLHWFGLARSTNLALNYFVAVASDVGTTFNYFSGPTGSNVCAYSLNGSSWAASTMPHTLNWSSVVYARKLRRFVAVAIGPGTVSNCATSDDGVTWVSRTCVSGNWASVCFSEDKGLFVAVGSNGNLMSSPDGITWTSRTSIHTGVWTSVIYNEYYEMYIAMAANGGNARFMRSFDGITWSNSGIANVPPAQQAQWNSLAHGLSGTTRSDIIIGVGGISAKNVVRSLIVTGLNDNVGYGTVSTDINNIFGNNILLGNEEGSLRIKSITNISDSRPCINPSSGALRLAGGLGIACDIDASNTVSGGSISSAG